MEFWAQVEQEERERWELEQANFALWAAAVEADQEFQAAEAARLFALVQCETEMATLWQEAA